jgi:hypothetical protein
MHKFEKAGIDLGLDTFRDVEPQRAEVGREATNGNGQ